MRPPVNQIIVQEQGIGVDISLVGQLVDPVLALIVIIRKPAPALIIIVQMTELSLMALFATNVLIILILQDLVLAKERVPAINVQAVIVVPRITVLKTPQPLAMSGTAVPGPRLHVHYTVV